MIIPRRLDIEERGATDGVSRLSARRSEASARSHTSASASRVPDHAPRTEQAEPERAAADPPALEASQAETEGRQLADTLRQEGISRARSIIANAEREAQAVIRSAKEAAEAAEAHARERAAAILEGKPAPPELNVQPRLAASQAGDATNTKISIMPPDGSTLRYRIAGPISFGALLQLKRDVSHLPGVSAVNVSPAEDGEAILSLHAQDSADVWQQLQTLPSREVGR